MTFEVIPNEQTPKVPEIKDIKLFLIENAEKLQAFKEFAETQYNAIGLAANQTSIDGERFMLRVFAIRNLNDNTWKLIIDPRIHEYVGIKELKCEGCLTWKGKKIVAERSRAVRVRYYNEIGEWVSYEFNKGLDAQIWQHETNHLNGIEERVEELSFVEPKPIEVGRNDKCPCDSGKKYKHCCLLLL